MNGKVLTSNERVSWYIVLYEWQGAHDLSDCREWFSGSDMFQSEVTARESVDKLRRKTEPVNGQLRYRNVRGPFTWAEPSQDETGAGPSCDEAYYRNIEKAARSVLEEAYARDRIGPDSRSINALVDAFNHVIPSAQETNTNDARPQIPARYAAAAAGSELTDTGSTPNGKGDV